MLWSRYRITVTQSRKEETMADLGTIDRDHTAVLIMDYQNDIVNSIAARQPQLLERAAAVLSGARLAGVPVMYVVVCFRPGYPEVSDRNAIFRTSPRSRRR